MLMLARWGDGTAVIEFGGTDWAISRGEFVTSLRILSGRWKWTVKRVRIFLDRLKKTKAISVQKRSHFGTHLKVHNYNDYQFNGAQQRARGGHTEGTPIKNKENKENKILLPESLRPFRPMLLEAYDFCRLYRKTGRISDSVWQRTLDKLARYNPETVENSLLAFLALPDRSKRHERYLLGIAKHEHDNPSPDQRTEAQRGAVSPKSSERFKYGTREADQRMRDAEMY